MTARVWLAEIGIFASSVAALSERELRQAITTQRSIRDIAELGHVSTSTVKVELHRHGLFDTHRRRHLGELQQ